MQPVEVRGIEWTDSDSDASGRSRSPSPVREARQPAAEPGPFAEAYAQRNYLQREVDAYIHLAHAEAGHMATEFAHAPRRQECLVNTAHVSLTPGTQRVSKVYKRLFQPRTPPVLQTRQVVAGLDSAANLALGLRYLLNQGENDADVLGVRLFSMLEAATLAELKDLQGPVHQTGADVARRNVDAGRVALALQFRVDPNVLDRETFPFMPDRNRRANFYEVAMWSRCFRARMLDYGDTDILFHQLDPVRQIRLEWGAAIMQRYAPMLHDNLVDALCLRAASYSVARCQGNRLLASVKELGASMGFLFGGAGGYTAAVRAGMAANVPVTLTWAGLLGSSATIGYTFSVICLLGAVGGAAYSINGAAEIYEKIKALRAQDVAHSRAMRYVAWRDATLAHGIQVGSLGIREVGRDAALRQVEDV